MGASYHPVIGAAVPVELQEAARAALGLSEGASNSELIRKALATVAGRDVSEFPVAAPNGPRPRKRRDATQAA